MRTYIHFMLVLVVAALCSPFVAKGRVLSWDPVVDPRVTGYVLYWGTSSGNYVFSTVCASNVTSATVSDLLPNQVYYFAVKAASASNVLSDFSIEAVITNDPASGDINPPLPGGTGTVWQTWGTNSQPPPKNGTNGSASF